MNSKLCFASALYETWATDMFSLPHQVLKILQGLTQKQKSVFFRTVKRSHGNSLPSNPTENTARLWKVDLGKDLKRTVCLWVLNLEHLQGNTHAHTLCVCVHTHFPGKSVSPQTLTSFKFSRLCAQNGRTFFSSPTVSTFRLRDWDDYFSW